MPRRARCRRSTSRRAEHAPLLAFAIGLLLALAAPALAEERITQFVSEVTVNADASLNVRETITVNAEGDVIKRGILRDFPTTYTDRSGQRVIVGFEVLGVKRDGRAEPYALESLSNGTRIRIGDKDVFLERGAAPLRDHLPHHAADRLLRGVRRALLERDRQWLDLPHRRGAGDDPPARRARRSSSMRNIPAGRAATADDAASSAPAAMSMRRRRRGGWSPRKASPWRWPGRRASSRRRPRASNGAGGSPTMPASSRWRWGFSPRPLYFLFAWNRVGRDPREGHHHSALRAAQGAGARLRALCHALWRRTTRALPPPSWGWR